MNLQEGFEAAGLVLKINTTPIAKTTVPVFQMDIRRELKGNSRKEYFVIYQPEGTIVQVSAVSKEWAQLVLSIKEPIKTFETEVHLGYRARNWDDPKIIKDLLERGAVRKAEDIVKRDNRWYSKQTTTGTTRFFLLGRDERQLFMCQIKRNATSIKDAHDSLKSPTVTLAEGKQLGKTIRQGEWFFVNATAAELDNIAYLLKANLVSIQKKIRVGGTTGKPHVADELIRLKGTKLEHGFAVRSEDTYVRGSIHHSDHKTVKFSTWRKVIRNNEEVSAGAVAGGTWID